MSLFAEKIVLNIELRRNSHFEVLRSYVKSGEAEAVYIGDENDELTSQFQVAAIQVCLEKKIVKALQ